MSQPGRSSSPWVLSWLLPLPAEAAERSALVRLLSNEQVDAGRVLKGRGRIASRMCQVCLRDRFVIAAHLHRLPPYSVEEGTMKAVGDSEAGNVAVVKFGRCFL